MQDRPDTDVLEQAVLLASRAPSVHNSQPWRWVAKSGTLRLFVDRRRRMPGTDPTGRQAVISCGAVLDHLRIAMLAAGWDSAIQRFPAPGDPDHLAFIDFRRVDDISDADCDRATAILRRRTDRLPLRRPPWWEFFEPTLHSACDDSTVTVEALGDETRPQLAAASALTAALRLDDSRYQSEIVWWTSPFVLTDGVPESTLPSVQERLRVDVGRDFPTECRTNRRPGVEVDESKALVLSTPDDSAVNALACGEMLSNVLLDCTVAGLASCTLTHLVELDESRDIVRSLLERDGRPQVVIRVGIAPSLETAPAPTPRRPLRTVLHTS